MRGTNVAGDMLLVLCAGARFGHGAASPGGVIPAAGGLPRLYLFGGVADSFGPGAAGQGRSCMPRHVKVCQVIGETRATSKYAR